jgi:hypothetical protein
MSGPPYPTAAILSSFLPGLGQAIKGHWIKTAEILILGLLIAVAWYFGIRFDGPFTSALLYVIVPVAAALWCGRQIYDAYASPTDGSLFPVLPLPARGSLDIQAIGLLFLLTAYTDLYIIQAKPEYALKILGTTFPGVWGILFKAQSPIFHVLIGVGFLMVKRWGLLAYLLYAGFGIVNAAVNLAVLPGPHRIRVIFMLSLVVFTTYILWRRKAFKPLLCHSERSEESH